MKVFDKITATTNGSPLPEPITKLYAAAGIPVGQKISMHKIDAALGTMNLSITDRMKTKFLLANLGIIAR
jgi:hypothetical protein